MCLSANHLQSCRAAQPSNALGAVNEALQAHLQDIIITILCMLFMQQHHRTDLDMQMLAAESANTLPVHNAAVVMLALKILTEGYEC